MIKNKNHNSFYFLTTLSVYLGLVIVGASPQVLAQAKPLNNSHAPSFEIHVKSNSVISELKFKADFERQDVSPFSVFNGLGKSSFMLIAANTGESYQNLYSQISAENNQVFVITNLPRASL